MKIFEIEKTNVHDLLNSRRRGELDRPTAWARPARETASAPAARATPIPIDHRAVNVRTGPKPLKLHVLDLGKLRLDKNFMVANSTVATARNPNPRGQVIDIPVSAYYIEHPDGNVLFDTGCHPNWGGPNGRWPVDGLQELFPHIGGEECM